MTEPQDEGAAPSRIVILLHGIKTRGSWQKQASPRFAEAGITAVPLDYGNFLALQMLIPSLRWRKVDWLQRQYERICRDYKVDRPSIVAHSFGTYMTARVIDKYELKFDRVVFCGAIVEPDYGWTERFDGGLVRRVMNQYGGMDFWAGVVAWGVEDAGPSGKVGFRDTADGRVYQLEHPYFKHSDYFFETNYDNVWIPFLAGKNDSPGVRSLRKNPRNNWRPRAVAAALLLAVVAASLAWWRYGSGGGPPRLGINDVYKNLCYSDQAGSQLLPILKHLHEPVSWKAEVVQVASGGGSVFSLQVRPVGSPPTEEKCRKIVVILESPVDLAFFGTRPEGMKIEVSGVFASFERSSATVSKARVKEAE